MRHLPFTQLMLAAILGALFVTPCSCRRSGTDGPGATSAATIPYTMHLVSQREGECGTGSGCAYVLLAFPEIQQGGASAAADSVRAAVRTFILAPVLPGTRVDSVGELTAQFIGSFKEAQHLFPGRRQWDLERRATILRDSAGIIAVELREFTFTGGAHPKTYLGYVNFDALSGKRLRLADVVIEGKEGELLSRAEKEFRVQKKIAEGTSLEEAGYRFTGGIFALNENFLLAGDTLLFHYNTYEIAPYAMGPTTVRIPLSTVRNIVRSASTAD